MERKVDSALLPEDWSVWEGCGEIHRPFFAALCHAGSDPGAIQLDARNGGEIASDERHAVAALCLHGQREGFSHSDVEFLVGLGEYLLMIGAGSATTRDKLQSVVDRIAALLPEPA